MCSLRLWIAALAATIESSWVASAAAATRETIWNSGHEYVFDISGYGSDPNPPKKILLINRSPSSPDPNPNDNEYFFLNSNGSITWASDQHDQTSLCLTAQSTEPAAALQMNWCSWTDQGPSYSLQEWTWQQSQKGYKLQLTGSNMCAFVSGDAENAAVQMNLCDVPGDSSGLYWQSSSSHRYTPPSPSPTPKPSPSPSPHPGPSPSPSPSLIASYWWIGVIAVVVVLVLVGILCCFCFKRRQNVSPEHPSMPLIPGSQPKKPKRKRNRFADGIQFLSESGARSFFPQGWIPDCDIDQALQRFGTDRETLANLKLKVSSKMEVLQAAVVGCMTVVHTTAIMAYTEENDFLYPPLNSAMRSYDEASKKKLNQWLSFVYFLDKALTSLPTFVGTTFRGIKVRMDQSLYRPGKTITWTQFSSSTKDPMVTLGFLDVTGQAASGTLFVITSQSGKQIQEYSVFPEEEEVLFTYNSHFRVEARCSSNEQKLKLVPQFNAYNVDALEVYKLTQL